MRLKLLFIGALPPPMTGQALACQVLADDLARDHDLRVVNLSKAGFRQGVDSLSRIGQVLSILKRVLSQQRGADRVYLTIAESTAGNIKDLLLMAACWPRLQRVVLHLHGGAGMRELLGPRHPWLRRINGWFLRRVGAVIVLGRTLAPIYDGLVAPGSVKAVANFATDDMFIDDAALQRKFAAAAPLRVLFLSNLLPGKGHEELLQACVQAGDAWHGRVQVDFAGGFESPAEEQQFRRRIAAVPWIRYHGVVQGEAKRRLFHDAHLFCLPTYYPYEGQPISILEAYAAGAAVLTTAHSGIPDIFATQVNGLQVEPRSAQSISQAVQRALDAPEQLRAFATANAALARSRYRTERFNADVRAILEEAQSTSA